MRLASSGPLSLGITTSVTRRSIFPVCFSESNNASVAFGAAITW